MTTRRQARLRPEICPGRLASGIQASANCRIPRRPQPRVHAAHRRAHHQPQVVHLQAFGQQAVLRLDHVGVAVAREPRAQAVARLARRAVADVVRQDDEVLRGVEQLAGAEQLAGEAVGEELRAAPGRAVHDQHGIAHDAGGVLPRRAERAVVHPQLGQRLARGEPEVPEHDVALGHRRTRLLLGVSASTQASAANVNIDRSSQSLGATAELALEATDFKNEQRSQRRKRRRSAVTR